MTGARVPGLPRLVVRLASLMLPQRQRREWRREWEAELVHRRADRPDRSGMVSLTRVALGSVNDAWALRARRPVSPGLGMEVRAGLRALGRRPLFAVLVVATLASAIGANATLFSVARDQLLDPFPYPNPDQVVSVQGRRRSAPDRGGNVTYPNMSDLALEATAFSDMAVIRSWGPALAGDGGAVVLRGATVTSNFFRLLGVEPGIGRFFAPEEQGEGREPVVVLSHGFWIARFGADRGIVGSNVLLNGLAHRVIGVTAADFEDPWLLGGPGAAPQVWRTVASPPSEWPRSGRSWRGVARIRDGVELEAAQAEIDGLMAALEQAYPEHNADRMMHLVPLRDRTAGPVRSAILLLAGAVTLLLLVAAANLMGLFLGRALERHREFAVRRALGASRWRVVRVALVEAGILSLMGGIAGLGITLVLMDGVQRLGASILPRPFEAGLDGGVLSFATGAVVGSACLFGLVPTLRSDAGAEAPQRAAQGATEGARGSRLRRGLVVAQVALTTLLLIGSVLTARSLQRLGQVDLGLDTEGVVSVTLHGSAWWDLSEPEAHGQWTAVLDGIRDIPGVRTAGAIDYVPMDGNFSCDGTYRDDLPKPAPGEGDCAEVRVILPGALETLGIRLLGGRSLARTDDAEAGAVALVDESLASALWPGQDPLGGRIRVHTRVHEVVGVVSDVRPFGASRSANPMLYLHAPQDGWNGSPRGLSVLIRGDGDPQALLARVRDAIAGVNPSIATGGVSTLETLERRSLSEPRFRTLLLSLFGGAALLLSLLGIVGVMTHSVARRHREMGVRLAIGARPSEVRGQVLSEGMRLTVLGVVLGVALALTLGGAVESLLFGVHGRDPMTYLIVASLVCAASLVSCYVPALRASQVDPVAALSGG